MKKICRLLNTLCVLSLAFTVSANADSLPSATLLQEQLEAIAIQPAGNWGDTQGVVPEMLDLFIEESIEFKGDTLKYRLHVPENLESGKKYPLVLWLHGIGERGGDNKLQLVHLHHIITSLTGEKNRDFFLLVPQHSSSDHWTNDGGASYRTGTNIPDDIKDDPEKRETFKKDLLEQTRAAAPPDASVTIEERKEIYQQSKPIKRVRTEKVGGLFGFGARTVEIEEIIGYDENDTDEKEIDLLIVSVETEAKKGGPLEFAFEMVNQVVEKYPVDTDRITVSGLSSGGDGTWRALERRPNLFAAAVPLVSWSALTDAAMEKSPILKKIPIWAIYSSDDNSIDSAREDFERVEKAGCNVKKTEFGICGHSAWTPAMLQADIFNWLLSRGKKEGEYIQVFDPGVDPDDMKGIVDVATRDTRPAPALAPKVDRITSTPVAPTGIGGMGMPSMPNSPPGMGGGMGGMMLPAISQFGPVHLPMAVPVPKDMEELMHARGQVYVMLADRYFAMAQKFLHEEKNAAKAEKLLERFARMFEKVSPEEQLDLLPQLIVRVRSPEELYVLEELLDDIQIYPAVSECVMPPPTAPVSTYTSDPFSEDIAIVEEVRPLSAERIIEECDRPWAMTSASLYGMFPADWDKEAEAIPEFIVHSTSEDLAKQLARSVGEDAEAKEFVSACRSILLLQHRPMSSPWFETSGGRLRSEIQYKLSQKGEMFVRFLRAVKDSTSTEKTRELSKVAERTLEKIDMVLAK